MRGRCVLVVVFGLGVWGARAVSPPPDAPPDVAGVRGFRYANTPKELLPYHGSRIYKYLFTEVPQYRGPGRDLPEPAEFKDVPIGFIGPLMAEDKPVLPPGRLPVAPDESKHDFGRSLLNGVTLAIEEANRHGGYKGKPFRLVRRTELVQWGQTSNELVEFKEKDHVWAVICSVDSNHNHVLARATLKVEMPLVNAGGSDPTSLEIAVPWTIRVMNDDRLNSYLLLHYLYKEKGLTRVAILRAGDRDARVGVAEFVQGAKRLGHPVLLEKQFRPGDTDFREQLEAIRQAAPDALLVWAHPKEGGLLLKQMRAMGLRQPVFGYDRMSHPLVLKYAGSAAEGLVAVSSYNPSSRDPLWVAFREHYRRRFGVEPDTFAAHGYDAATLVVRAIRQAGLNRYRIRDALFANRKVHGVTGEIVFDTNLCDIGLPWLAEVRGGRFHYFRGGWWESAPLAEFTASFR